MSSRVSGVLNSTRSNAVGLCAPLLALVFACFLGGFASGANVYNVAAGMAILVTLAAAGAWIGGWDPLGLSGSSAKEKGPVWQRFVGLAPWLCLAVVAASWWNSPVSRAGLLVLCYGPWLLLLVPALRRSLANEGRRIWAEVGFSVAVIVVSIWALYEWRVLGSPRVSMPLGHHNLLALWLVATLPLAALPSLWKDGDRAGNQGRDASAGSEGQLLSDWARPLGLLAAALGVLTLLLTRSLAGALGLAVQLVWVVLKAPGAQTSSQQRRRLLFGATTAVAVLVTVGWRRFALILQGGSERSFLARWEYVQAAVGGFFERPFLGWGPGASAWTLSLHLDPKARFVQRGVTDAHSLPFDLFYEIGALGVLSLLAVAVLWAVARLRARETARGSDERTWASVSNVALVGLITASIAGGFFDVLALWILVPILLATRLGPERSLCSPETSRQLWGLTASIGAVALVAVCLNPLMSHLAQQQANDAFGGERIALLKQAVRFDSNHPLALTVLAAERGSSVQALQAAELSVGLAPLHLRSGYLHHLERELSFQPDSPTNVESISSREAERSLRSACDLDLADPVAPYLLAKVIDPAPAARSRAETRNLVLEALARSLLARPALLATPDLLELTSLRAEAVDLLRQREEIPVGWRAALLDSSTLLSDWYASKAVGIEQRETVFIFADREWETSFSLFSYRRVAEPKLLARVEVATEASAQIQIPPAAELEGFDFSLLADGCRLSPPQESSG